MDLEYLIQKFAINGAFSSPKNNVCFFDFYSFDSVTFLLTINIEPFFFIMEYECRYCFFTALLAVSCALFL